MLKPGILIIDAPRLVLHPWWLLIRGSAPDQRQTALRRITKYNVKGVARPPLCITQARVVERLRDRTLAEHVRLESDQELSQGSGINSKPGFSRTTHQRVSRQNGIGGAPPMQSRGPNMVTYFFMVRAAETQAQRRPGALSRTRTETPPWPWTAKP